MSKKERKRNNQYELSWFDGRRQNRIQCDDKRRRRMLYVLETLPWVSQVRVVQLRR